MINRNSGSQIQASFILSQINNTLIPSEIWLLIFSYLSHTDILSLSLVSRFFHFLCGSEVLWNPSPRNSQSPEEYSVNSCAKLNFFNINPQLQAIIHNPDHPLVLFILRHKPKLSADDRNFIRTLTASFHEMNHDHELHDGRRRLRIMNESSNIEKNRANKFVFPYFDENPFIFCAEFISIPVVRKYVTTLTRASFFTAPLDDFFSHPGSMDYRTPHATACLQRLLLCCLLAEIDEKQFGAVLSQYHINETYQFPRLAHQNGITSAPVKNAKDLYALSNIFVQHQKEYIQSEFILQFHSAYRAFLNCFSTDSKDLIASLSEEIERMHIRLSL